MPHFKVLYYYIYIFYYLMISIIIIFIIIEVYIIYKQHFTVVAGSDRANFKYCVYCV